MDMVFFLLGLNFLPREIDNAAVKRIGRMIELKSAPCSLQGFREEERKEKR